MPSEDELEQQPFGILQGSCVFPKSALVEVQARWDNLLRLGLLSHLPEYEWNEKEFCLQQVEKN